MEIKLQPDHLSKLFLFRGECIELLEWIIDTCPVISISEGEVLLRKGQVNSDLYILITGRLRVQLNDSDTAAINFIGEGQCVGELSVLEGKHTSASVLADSDCRLLKVNEDILWSLIDRSQIIAKNLLKLLCTRVRNDGHIISDNIYLKKVFERNSVTDPLTGLFNRGWLNQTLSQYTSRNQPLCLMMLDIDYFKIYNDTHGHLSGDSAICAVTRAITDNLRNNDSAARYGGEEFSVLLPNTQLDEAVDIAMRLCSSIQSKIIIDNNGKKLPTVTVSIGVAENCGHNDYNSLIEKADTALYRAKQSGRNQVSI